MVSRGVRRFNSVQRQGEVLDGFQVFAGRREVVVADLSANAAETLATSDASGRLAMFHDEEVRDVHARFVAHGAEDEYMKVYDALTRIKA